MYKTKILITIDRQKGSGGDYLGRRLAEKLNISYYDDEIVREAAKELNSPVEELQALDEKHSSLLMSIFLSAQGTVRYYPELDVVTDHKAYNAESNIVLKVASEKSAVIIGRAASYLLRGNPRHVSIFLHADMDIRVKRTQELNRISEEEAIKLIQKTDKQRLRYYKEFAGMDMYNSCNYDLTIDTGKLGFEKSETLILDFLEKIYGNQLNWL
ncbi:cytidylate kinase-like family protein [Parasporobacterium paucivorans]|uniref:Cytidylate kinase n=1 Tax=Parasporobacterium paucivorans DSM 15970 TaxID=1122934 RepID=A0A1M6L2S1_9FIRM|nr:cytidylate kinase-like family protein [Parasporobacterium paucivorans]SHJ65466.1 cytidylate kinase [Parasporobacterium paucivorans DSM 15970]